MGINKNMKNHIGFSLIEIIVVISILSLLITGAVFVGFPEYNRYLISSERDYLVDMLLESRARSMVGESLFVVGTWSNGYCIMDSSGLCVVPVHDLPANMSLISLVSATSTKMIIAFSDVGSGSAPNEEIIIDRNGFINGK